MRYYIHAFAIALIAASSSGCMTTGPAFPTPTAGYTAKEAYPVSSAKAWDAVIAALNGNHIAILSAAHETGQIRTDNITGPGGMNGLTSQRTRYRYTVFISPAGSKKSKIDVAVVIEDSMNAITGGAETQYHDATSQNAALASSLRNWLYEQIDNQLKA